MKKAISLFLALFAVSIVIASCAGGEQPGDGSSGTDSASISETGADTTEGIDILTPEKFDGKDFLIVYRDINGSRGWGEWAVYTEEDDGTVISSAVWMRNLELSETYDVKLKYNHVVDRGVRNTDFYDLLNASYSSGDVIGDLCIPGVMDATGFVYQGYFTDLNKLPEINFDRSWWRKNINQSLEIAGKQYYAIHDMLLNDIRDTFPLYFNKDVMDDNNMAYPYDLVYDGKWTLETFGTMVRGFGGDLDGDDTVTTKDRFGLITAYNDVFFVGSGIVGASLDPETGLPVITEFTPKMARIYDWLTELQTANDYDVWNYMARGESNMQELFDQKSLFLNRSMNMLQFFSASYESRIGVLPIPKYDEAQSHYISRAGFSGTTVLTIPANVEDPHMSAVMAEAFGAASQKYIRPAFYEKMLGARYIDDLVNDKNMIDIVISGEVLDIDQVYQFANILVKFAHDAYSGGAAASTYENLRSSAQAKLDALLGYLQNQ